MLSMHFWHKRQIKALIKNRQQWATREFPRDLQILLSEPQLTPKTNIKSFDILALDFETTGFDPDKNHVISMGWVILHQGIIELQLARHLLINETSEPVNESVKIHHLLPQELHNKGIHIAYAYQQLFKAMAGKLILAHGSVIENGYIQHYIQQHYGVSSFPMLWLDTLKIEQSKVQLFSPPQDKKDWRLAVIRERYGLPSYPAHHALVDAIATAELFLAQMKVMFGNCDICLADVLSLSN
ncbi:exonuclease domain-containing protein [Celerinatantimonas sp. YJH-8]|uniref:3'-5' exonuclease n=1 Tax=Celerinatantimonas sp. YJH-8 TaxID=3228714 RepID=UPI0038C4112E